MPMNCRMIADPGALGALRLLARAWVEAKTGVLQFREHGGAPIRALPILAGGVRSEAGIADLKGALHAVEVSLLSRRSDQVGLRAPVAALLAREALCATDGAWLADRPTPDITLLAPLARLEELGLYPVLQWRLPIDGVLTELSGRAALGCQLKAMERLGLARIVARTASASTGDSPRARARNYPTVPIDQFGEEDFFAAGGIEDDHTSVLDLGSLAFAQVSDDADERLSAARALLGSGRWREAESCLTALRDVRLDNPCVLGWLAVALVSDPARRSPERLAEARSYARVAQSLGADALDLQAALHEFSLLIEAPGGADLRQVG